MTNNKPTQVVDFTNSNAGRVTSGSTKQMTNETKQTHICVFEKSKTSNSNEAKCKYCNVVRYVINVKNITYGDNK